MVKWYFSNFFFLSAYFLLTNVHLRRDLNLSLKPTTQNRGIADVPIFILSYRKEGMEGYYNKMIW